MSIGESGRLIRFVLFWALLLSLTACDGVVVVEGTIASAGNEALDDCAAKLIGAEGYELDPRPIDPDFSATFTVMPGERQYFTEVTCEGHSTYRSPPFYSSGVLGDPPAQLGEIVLEPLPGGGGRSSAPQRPAP
jgi:hypothetical protein